MSWVLFIFLLVAVVLLHRSVVFVEPGRRLVVYRLGKFHDVKRSGLHVLIPFLERADRVDLDTVLPEWRGLDSWEIDRTVVGTLFGAGELGEWERRRAAGDSE